MEIIEKEVLNIINKRSATLQGTLLNQLTDQFRSGRNPADLLNLISSSDKDFIEIGTYIIREIIIYDPGINDSIIRQLNELLQHDDPNIRLNILITLSPLLKEKGANEEQQLYRKMSKDEDDKVKDTAIRLLKTGRLN